MIDVFVTYLRTVPWTALMSSPYGGFLRAGHPRRLLVHYDGDTLMAGGFIVSGRIDVKSSWKADFTFRKKVSPTQWFVEECPEIPRHWYKEHVSFFTGARIFNMTCVTSSLPSNTAVEVNYAQDHPIAINMTRWAEVNKANLHYASVACLELALQWHSSRKGWSGDRDLKFFLGHDGSQWFLCGANSTGICAFHQMDHPYELPENVNGFYVTLNPETFSEMSFFAPGREEEASDAVSNLKDNYFPDLVIDDKPFGDLQVHPHGAVNQEALLFLSGLLPRKVSHG